MAFDNGLEPATILSAASLSAAVDLQNMKLVGLQMPSAWTTANLTFQGSFNGTTFADVYDSDGTEVTVTAAAARYIILDPATFAAFRKIKVRSGTTGSAVTQSADRTIQLVVIG